MLDLITQRPLIWGLFASYMAITSVLAWIGHRRTKDLSSFAVGGRQMSPIIVGITLAASIASTATFVINPGFVYGTAPRAAPTISSSAAIEAACRRAHNQVSIVKTAPTPSVS